jgi:CheY-like chemotaxis protein
MATILIVDDTTLERRRAGGLLEKDAGTGVELKIEYAADGCEALAALQRVPIDLVVTDLHMPKKNGLELVEEIRTTFPSVPVILMTAFGSEEIAAQALRAGAAGYVPKRYLARDLRDTVDKTLELTRDARQQQRVLEYLAESEYRFQLETDLSLIPPLVGYLQNNLKRRKLCDEVAELRVVIALREALLNAFAHGNLEASSELRETDDRAYRNLIEQRRTQAPYRDRRIHVHVRESPAEVNYVIRDEGPGFNPASLPDPTDPANLEKCSGRGLLLIRTFMDEVRHNEQGNEITMIKRRPLSDA